MYIFAYLTKRNIRTALETKVGLLVGVEGQLWDRVEGFLREGMTPPWACLFNTV